MLKVFSVFRFLSLVIFLCPFFLSVFFPHRFRFGGNLSLCSNLPDRSRAYFLSLFLVSGCFYPLLHFLCSAHSWVSLSSLGSFSFGLMLVDLFLLFSLVFISICCCYMTFSPCTLVFPLLCMHHIYQVLFYSGLWLLLYILHLFF